MKLLVTGASGLIGTALVERSRREGHAVTRLVRSGSSPSQDTGAVTWAPEQGQIDVSALERAGPFDGVVHLAGAGIGDRRWSPDRKRVVLDSRTDSTRLLVDTLVRLSAPPPVLVSASAVGIYGDRGDEELTEASTTGTGFLAEVCRAWEAAAQPAADAGIRTVLLRTGIVLSRHGGAWGKQLPLFRVGLGGRMGSGDQYRSWITLDDEIGAVLHCLARRRPLRSGQCHRAGAGHRHRAGRGHRHGAAPAHASGRAGRPACDCSSVPRWPTNWCSVASGSSPGPSSRRDTPSPTPSCPVPSARS